VAQRVPRGQAELAAGHLHPPDIQPCPQVEVVDSGKPELSPVCSTSPSRRFFCSSSVRLVLRISTRCSPRLRRASSSPCSFLNDLARSLVLPGRYDMFRDCETSVKRLVCELPLLRP
jgi:hypothetical protein